MEYLPPALETLVEQFARLPGVGKKSAQRLAFFVLDLPDGEAQAFADKIRWRGSSEYYIRPWGPWKKLFTDATRISVTGERIRVWRRDARYSHMEPTLEHNTLSGREPTLL